MNVKNFFLKTLYPDICFICGAVLPFNSSVPHICNKCNFSQELIPVKICESCGRTRDISPLSPLCPYCNGEKFGFDNFLSPFIYDGGIKLSLHAYKFGNRFSNAETYAYYMYLKMKYLENFDIDVIVPAPSSKKRLNMRGFNHILLIAKYLSLYMSVPYDDILVKTRHTLPQSKLSAKERASNLKDAFSCKEHSYKNILLIDDIYTTGSTVKELCKVLKKSGAKKVFVSTLAITSK